MEKKRVIKLNVMILAILIIVGLILFVVFSKKMEILISKNEIKEIANDDQYEIEDKQLKKFYNDLLGEGELIVSKESANTLEEAKNLSIEYKNKVNTELSNRNYVKPSESYTNFEYINFVETDYYYKYIGEYSIKYKTTSTPIKDHSVKFVFLIFKSDYFEYPYLKKYNDKYSVKEFGDMLAIMSGNRKIIKSEVKENGKSFTYNVYYISKSWGGPKPDSSGVVLDVITEEHYFLEKATFTVNKSTGRTNLNIKQGLFDGDMEYINSYYPCMNSKIIKSCSEAK